MVWIIGSIVAVLLSIILIIWLIGFRILPNDKIAVVEKWWSPKGNLEEKIIALKGEAGYQPQVLRGGYTYIITINILTFKAMKVKRNIKEHFKKLQKLKLLQRLRQRKKLELVLVKL